MSVQNDIQLSVFDIGSLQMPSLDAKLWHGSFNARECALQQISPYVGKMKSGMARALITIYSRPGDVLLDPFAGSGVVPLEAVLTGRIAWANDLSPYAYTVTKGKLSAPLSVTEAVHKAQAVADVAEDMADSVDLQSVPDWVREFFHPRTLQETLIAFRVLRDADDCFLLGCLLGILHHVRPGFLSYPASHLVPYLRKKMYPPEDFGQMYAYRDLRSRLVAKVKRMYRTPLHNWSAREYKVWRHNAMSVPIPDASVDSIISSPPYFGALDYARDNRLRLWFLGCTNWRDLDKSLTANSKVYVSQMTECLKEMHRVLRNSSRCILVLGDVESDGDTRHTAEILANIALDITEGGFVVETIYDDHIPDERRSRRRTKTTKFDRILVLKKR